MKHLPRVASIIGLVALFTPGLRAVASADVVNLYNFNVATLNGSTPTTVFNDNFGQNQTLSGPSGGAVQPAGPTYSDATTALYVVIGTVTETGASPTLLDTAQGALLTQSSPGFNPEIKANIVTLLTGPPGSPPPLSNFPLTQTSSFTTSGLFDVTRPASAGGFYQINLSNRVPSNNFLGDVISMAVENCEAASCPGQANGDYIALLDANAVAGTTAVIASVPLDTTNQQILLELTKPDPLSGTVDGCYEYFNNGIGSGLTCPAGWSYSGLFGSGPGQLDYTEAGFVQLAPVVGLAPVPEPSSLALLAGSIPGVIGFGWRRRRTATGPATSSQQVTSP
jgi:hypothetical protein